MPLVGKGNCESILVDTSVMSLPLTAFSMAANGLLKEKFGLPVGCAASNGTYMFRKAAGERGLAWFPAVDAAIEAMVAVASDFVFYGPMSGNARVFAAVAAAYSVLATQAHIEGAPLPAGGQPLNKLFPETVEQLLNEGGN